MGEKIGGERVEHGARPRRIIEAEVVSTEATGRRNSMQEGEHEAKNEEEG